jgi:uncharacterized protein YuzE
VRYTYDEVADAIYLYLVDTIAPDQTRRSEFIPLEIRGASLIAALDEAGNALGIEFLGASRLFTAEALEGFRAGRTPFDMS